MTWNLFGQYLDIALTSVLVIRIFKLGLHSKYLACLAFVFFQSFGSLTYLGDLALEQRHIHLIDYRLLWFSTELLAWITTVWMVYSVLIAILKQLPGILQFSLRFLNIVFVICIVTALITIRPQYAASMPQNAVGWLWQLSIITGVVSRALAFAELLAILVVLAFVLRFPMRVPRNLAAFSAGLVIYLFITISFLLLRTYLPQFLKTPGVIAIPAYFIAACLIYWIFFIDSAGELAVVTLGRGWQTVPQESLVRQLEAINASLLRSREQT